MKKVKKKHIEATKFYIEENEEGWSKTKVAELYGSDRHMILSLEKTYKDYFESARPEDKDYMFCFNRNEKEAIDYYINNPTCFKNEVLEKFCIGKTTTLDNWLEICGYSSERRYTYNFNRDYFKQEPNEEMCYWLGFLLADGCVTGSHNTAHIVQIKLADRDKEHLFKFAKSLGFSDEQASQIITSDFGGAYTRDNLCWGMDISSVEIVRDLEKYNILPRKSMKEKPFIFDNEELELAYIRGIIDGDGWVSAPTNRNKRMGVCGSKEVCEYIRSVLSRYTNEYVLPVVQKDKSIDPNKLQLYNWNMTNHKGTADILKRLYPKDAQVYLTRKFENAWAVIKLLD